MTVESKLRERIVMHGRSLYERGLAPGTSGNISVRLDDGLLITPTNSCLGRLDPAEISRLDFAGRALSGQPPSKELPLHRLMHEARPQTNAVVHLHSTYSVATSCLDGLDPLSAVPMLTPYFVMRVGAVALVPYFRPGDPAVVEAARPLACNHRGLLLANHGPIVAGSDLDGAVYAIEELEETAKLGILLGTRAHNTLSDALIRDVCNHFPS